MASRLMLAFEAVSPKLMTDDGRKLEVSLGHRLHVEITLQITRRGSMLEGSGTDRSKVAHFCKRLERLLVAKQSAGIHSCRRG